MTRSASHRGVHSNMHCSLVPRPLHALPLAVCKTIVVRIIIYQTKFWSYIPAIPPTCISSGPVWKFCKCVWGNKGIRHKVYVLNQNSTSEKTQEAVNTAACSSNTTPTKHQHKKTRKAYKSHPFVFLCSHLSQVTSVCSV